MRNGIAALLMLLMMTGFAARAAESAAADHVRVSWLAPSEFAPVRTTIGLRFRIDPEWHIYWKNAGDSGAAPKFQFTSGETVVGPIQWPFPHRLPLGDLTNFGYEKEVVFPFTIDPSGEHVHLDARLEWLVCKVECLPGFGTITLDRPVRAGASTDWPPGQQSLLREFVERVPARGESSPWRIDGATLQAPSGLRVVAHGPGGEVPEIYPVDGDFLLPAKPVFSAGDNGGEFLFQTRGGREAPSTTGFVLVSEARAWEFPAVKVSAPTPILAAGSADAASLILILLSAFVGGILLNLMPCVFPVLSIKVFSLMKGHPSKTELVREGVFYAAGVLVTFLALGGLFLGLRAAGSAVGWGFQLQSPLIILGLAVLFWLMGLNFFGVFEMGDRLMIWAGRYNTAGSSFATGVLSVFVAAPCTGPFMGTALGSSATLPAPQALGIFLGLGAGLAFPFVLLTFFPPLLSRLPKPGAWMESLKQFLAFPLFATVLWLLWVLGRQIGDGAWTVGGSLLLGLSFVIWLGAGGKKWRTRLAWLLGVVMIVGASASVRSAAMMEKKAEAGSGWAAFDPAAVERARAENQAVFIDFTAAWCITCQWNKKAVLETSPIRELFARNKVLLVRADWTNYDPMITQALAALGRNSVPVYVYYAPGAKEPRILPQLLTSGSIEELFTSHKEDEK